MKFFNKHIKYLLLLAITMLSFVVQVKAQFDDDGGPGDFDPPADNDVPLDTYQWVMMLLAIGYGIYVYRKHQQKIKALQVKTIK